MVEIKRKITLTLFSETQQAAENESEVNVNTADGETAAENILQDDAAAAAPQETPEPEKESLPDNGDELKKALFSAKKESIKKSWSEDAEKLKEIYPSFDIGGEIRDNEQFRMLLSAGVPVRSAYEVAHIEEIIGTAMRYAAQKASEKIANSVISGSARPAENGIMNSSPSVTKTDVRSLTEKDILKILDRVSKGETVSF